MTTTTREPESPKITGFCIDTIDCEEASCNQIYAHIVTAFEGNTFEGNNICFCLDSNKACQSKVILSKEQTLSLIEQLERLV